ncbi:hypothetical protein GcM3_059035 [Golovinomyces cichoracearum]|uniref:MULE transposase domain-containing protein n=1 Tax=Golovinomyces cichoracearum TaxID=62708 RepID=A0A420IWT2_9PEZI|nr:hypothetical protein GcM3_059035 [Golovinomyces cichoracearum]
MINICGSAGNSMTPQLAVNVVSGEKEKDYKWVLNCTKQLLIIYNIPFPKVWITDRELALMKAVETIFLTSDHILCRWHVNMNVFDCCKQYFKVQKEWDAFDTTWIKLIDSTTLEDVRKNFEMSWKENIVTYWVDQIPHFGNRTTSRNESSHRAIKAYLRVSTDDLKHVFDALVNFWSDQHRNMREAINVLYPNVWGSPASIISAKDNKQQISNQDSCRILLNPHKDNGKVRPQGSIKQLPSAAEVAKSDNKKRKGYGSSSNRRDLSLFEHEAIDLPLSSALPRLEIAPPPKKKSRSSYFLTTAIVDQEKNETTYSSITASTTSTASTPSIPALPPTSAAHSRC